MTEWDFLFLRFCIGSALQQARISLKDGDVLLAAKNLGRADAFINQGINGGSTNHSVFFLQAYTALNKMWENLRNG